MFDKKFLKYAGSLTWRFVVCFVVFSYPVFTQMMQIMKSLAATPEAIPSTTTLLFFLIMNLLIPFVIPFLSMCCALAWYYRGKQNVLA